MTTTATSRVEGKVDHVVVPVTIGLRSGTMRLADGRLRYTRRFRRRVVFDAPVGEFHSFARSSLGTGFHLWHGGTRHRFVVYHPVVPVTAGAGLAADLVEGVSTVRQGLAAQARSQRDVESWEQALVPVIAAAPPPGVRVRPPFSRRGYILAALAFAISTTLLLMAIITAVVFATA
jgi:hypothetical protein